MSLIRMYCCEICGVEKHAVNNWLLGEIMPNGILVSHWHDERAQSAGVHHFCGEDHAQIYVSRYLASPSTFAALRPGVLDPREKDLTSVQSHLITKVLQSTGEMSQEADEIFDLLAAAEAALKGKVTVDSLNGDRFDA